MIVPSTIVCGSNGCMPNACSAQPLPFLRSWTTLTLLEPISRPMHCLPMDPLHDAPEPSREPPLIMVGRSAPISKNCLPQVPTRRARTRFDKSGDPVVLHLVEQRPMADFEELGGVGAVSLRRLERAPDQVRF